MRYLPFPALMLMACSGLAEAGPTNTEEVCRRIADAAGGGAAVEVACWEAEEAAIDELAEIFATLPTPVPKAWPYCMRVAEAAGGSQQVRLACWKKETGAEGG